MSYYEFMPSDLASIILTEPWFAILDSEINPIVAELQRELSAEHLLFGQPVSAIARRQDCDDVLVRFGQSPPRYAVVHLTWSGKREISPEWPATQVFNSLDQFVQKMQQDSVE